MCDLTQFSMRNMVQCGAALRKIGEQAASVEDVAARIVGTLDESFQIPGTGEPACVLVRLFKTYPYERLPADLREIVRRELAPTLPDPRTPCLALLGSCGLLPEWRDRTRSKGHRVIPLPSAEAVTRLPMVLELIRQLGGDAGSVPLYAQDLLVEPGHGVFNVFHVPEAAGCACIPSQEDFVIRHGVRSVLGFGGLLPGNDLFAVILFSRAPIPRNTAEMFRPMALYVKLALLPFLGDSGGPSLRAAEPAPAGSTQAPAPAVPESAALASQSVALKQLLDVVEPTIMDQSSQLELALAESRNLLESAVDVIVIADGEGRIVRLNQRAEQMFGYSRDELIGQPVEMLVPEPLRGRHVGLREGYVARRPPREPLVNVEIRARHRSGATIPFEMTVSPVETAQRLLVVVILRDITERKHAEEQLKKQNLLLEARAHSERVAHEARKRLESQLIQSEKLAALGQMVAGVAHEVNNPLAFVRNNLAILQRDLGYLRGLIELYQQADDALGAARPELLGRIRTFSEQIDLGYTLANVEGLAARSGDGLTRIQQIVKNLRDFARLDEAELKEIDLAESIETTVAIARLPAHQKRVELVTDLARLPRLLCHPAKLNQVVLNLLTNAIDATPEGGTITLRTRADAEFGLAIEINDTGEGVDPAIRDKIFDPFFTTKPVGKGTGLGLSIAYGIVQLHGGRISFDSEPGKGTRFTVQLPLVPKISVGAAAATATDVGADHQPREENIQA